MKVTRTVLALALTALISGCGSGFNPNAHLFTSIVSYGDSLSDVGTYAVGGIAAGGGGKFTINGTSNMIWVEDLANALSLPAPCAAETGLMGDPAYGFNVPVTTHAGCLGYAQGGSRVTNPVGPGNALLGGSNAITGFLTVPVVTQMQNYLSANNGHYTGKELVTVWAGANDIFINLSLVSAQAETPQQAVAAVEQAAQEEIVDVNNLVVNNGANYVVLMNLPDISLTPMALAEPGSSQAFIKQLSQAYNAVLTNGMKGLPASKVMLYDTFTASETEVAQASTYGLTNTTTPACNLAPAANPLGSSILCSAANLSGTNVLNYEYADGVHPTPYAHALLAKGVLQAMVAQGWY